MTVDVHYLDVSRDVEEYARRFGAVRDRSGHWYVVGEMPPELLNLLPRRDNAHFYEVVPTCPFCGNTMRKRGDSATGLHWECAARARTGCRGIVEYDDYLNQVAPTSRVGDFLPTLGSLLLPEPSQPDPPLAPSIQRQSHPLRERWLEIVEMAFQVLGDEHQALRWLEQPKVALNGKPPIRVLGTSAGCDAVLRMLRDVWA